MRSLSRNSDGAIYERGMVSIRGRILNLDKRFLYEEYVVKEKTMREIADEIGVSVGAVFNHMKRYEIQPRKSMREKARKKLSEERTGRPSPQKGVKWLADRRAKLSEAKKGVFHKKTKYGGHRKKRHDGYISVYCPSHPNATKDGYVMEHILVMEEHIKRHLRPEEVVHHINRIRDDNRIENLQLMTFKEHAGLHMRERWAKKKGVMTYQ